MRCFNTLSALSLALLLAACTAPASDDAMMEDDEMKDDAVMEESEEAEETEEVEEASGFSGTKTEMNASASSLTFVGGSTIIDHDGGFRTFSVDLTPDSTDPADFTKAQLSATVDTTSIYSDSSRLDGHLLKEEFFDVENYPEATFVSASIVQNADGSYAITGPMTVKGVTADMTFTGTVTDDGMMLSGSLPRKTFGIGNDHYGDKILDEQVPLEITVALR